MAITGLTLPATTAVVALSRPNVGEAVDVTIKLLTRLGVVSDEQSLRDSLTCDYQRLAELGDGRLYVELPAAVTFDRLVALANDLATKRGFGSALVWAPFWVPGTEKESVTERELNGDDAGFTARIALFRKEESDNDRLLHFTGVPYDGKYAKRKEATQLDLIELAQANFAQAYAGASLRPTDQRDFLVWYLMDLIREIPMNEIVLAAGYMRVPRHGRRAVDGGSCVGCVLSVGGRAWLDSSRGGAYDGFGVGLSAGFKA